MLADILPQPAYQPLVVHLATLPPLPEPSGFLGVSPDAWVAFFTLALVIVSGWQGVLILRAEKIARTSADAAKESAEAAKKSADATFASQRAWLQLTLISHGHAIVNQADGSWSMDLELLVQNVGNVPATEVKEFVFAERSLTHKTFGELRRQFDGQKENLGRIREGYVLFPGQDRKTTMRFIVPKEQVLAASANEAGGVVPALMACVSYRTSEILVGTCTTFQVCRLMPPPNHRIGLSMAMANSQLNVTPAALGSFAT